MLTLIADSLRRAASGLQDRLPRGSLRGRFARGAFWTTAGAGVSRLATLTSAVIVARILGKVMYGELGMVMATVTMFTAYASMRLGVTAARYVAEFRERDPAKAGRILGLASLTAIISGGIVTLVAICSAPYISLHAINAPHLRIAIQLGSVILLFEAISGAQRGALTGYEAFRSAAKADLIVAICTLPIVLGGAYVFGLIGAVAGRGLQSLSGCFLYHLAVRRESRRWAVRLTIRGLASELPILYRFSLPAVLGGVIVAPAIWVASAMLANQPGGFGEMGIFSAARQWWGALLILPQLLAQVNLPILTDRFTATDPKGVQKVLLASVGVNALLSIPAAVVLSILSPWVMFMYGEGFRTGAPTLVLLVWAATLAAIQQPVAQVIIASSRMWLSFLTNAIWAASLLTIFSFLQDTGASGLATSFLLSYALLMGITATLALRLAGRGIAPEPGTRRLVPADRT